MAAGVRGFTFATDGETHAIVAEHARQAGVTMSDYLRRVIYAFHGLRPPADRRPRLPALPLVPKGAVNAGPPPDMPERVDRATFARLRPEIAAEAEARARRLAGAAQEADRAIDRALTHTRGGR